MLLGTSAPLLQNYYQNCFFCIVVIILITPKILLRDNHCTLCAFFFSFIKDWSYFCCYCFGNYFLSVIVLVFVGFFFGGGVEGAQGEKEIYGHNDNEKRKTYGLLHQSVHLYILVLTSKIHTL